MKIVKRLIAHGCSFTYGEELKEPASTSWSALVAKHLEIEHVNLALPGYSNDGIVEDIVRFNPDQDDLVIVCWTTYLRMLFKDDKGWYSSIRSRALDPDIDWNRRNRIVNELRMTNSDEWLYERWLTQVILLQSFLDSKAIKYLFFSAFDNQDRFKVYKKKLYSLHDRINKHRFVGWPNKGFVDWSYGHPIGSFNHPLEEGHASVAQEVIKSCKLVHDLPRKLFGE